MGPIESLLTNLDARILGRTLEPTREAWYLAELLIST
jgi:hypothetical protein